jgi:hypothetical protein
MLAALTNSLLFPLPSDEKSYVDYAAKVKAMFPQADLRAVHAGTHDFLIGPNSDLRFLFPEEGKNRDVYTARHEKRQGVYTR